MSSTADASAMGTTGVAGGTTASPSLGALNLDSLRAAPLRTDPYPFVIAHGALRPEALPALRHDFPMLRQTGFHPTDSFTPEGAFAALLRELEGPEIAATLSEKLGVDLTGLPRLITVRRLSAAHEGRIHTDSASKVCTLLVYLHEGWSAPEGRLRILRGADSFEDYVAEVSPEEGNMLAFLRSDHSWHGHTPFVGERRVVQVAWLRDASELERKRKRHGLSHFLRRLTGREQRH
ncbi:MAG TPA: 2OG-Fe(II) oxygenase [Roseomonas sp.]|nr:2OG-Fe(II) oxygenase [Roseomonas sp.]